MRTPSDKAAALDAYSRARAAGASMAEAVAASGVPKATILRWRAQGSEVGGRRSEGRKKGRRAGHEFDEAECAALRLLRLTHLSLAQAVSRFLRHEACRPETAAYLGGILERAAVSGRSPSWPPCVRRAAHVPAEFEAD